MSSKNTTMAEVTHRVRKRMCLPTRGLDARRGLRVMMPSSASSNAMAPPRVTEMICGEGRGVRVGGRGREQDSSPQTNEIDKQHLNGRERGLFLIDDE